MSLIKMTFKIEMACAKCGKRTEVDLVHEGDDLKAGAAVLGQLDMQIRTLKMTASPDLKPMCSPKC